MRTVMRCVPVGREKFSTSPATSSLLGTKTVSPSLVTMRVDRQPISTIRPTRLPTSIQSPWPSVRSSCRPRPPKTFASVDWRASPTTAVSTAEVVTSEKRSRPARRRKPMTSATATENEEQVADDRRHVHPEPGEHEVEENEPRERDEADAEHEHADDLDERP